MDLLDGLDVKCPACGRRARYPTVHAGKTVTCPGCKKQLIVPAQDGTGMHPVMTDDMAQTHAAAEAAAATPPPPPEKKAAPAADEKILFVCGSCQYRARIPGQYAGMAVRCPSCNEAQIASSDGGTGSTGKTVQLSKIPTANHKTTIRPGNILFICSQCNFEAQLAKHYVGKAIRCPGCHAPQVVAGEEPKVDAEALERHANAPVTPGSDPRFICVGCGYRARIPGQYMGLAVTCPKCDTVQIATPEEQEGPSTGDTVAISRMQTAGANAKVANPQVAITNEPVIKGPSPKPAPPAAPGDKVRFTCSSCGFKARIPAQYAGENIHCPSCNAVQLVLRSGQLSPNATGNTQVLQVVQTAEGAASPDAIATPTNTPSRGVPIIADPDKDKPAPPPPVKPAAAKPAPPPAPAPPREQAAGPQKTPPALPVAQPAGTAAAETSVDDLLNFEDPPKEEPKVDGSIGKVVRRKSDRLAAVQDSKPAEPASVADDNDEPEKPVIEESKKKKGTGRMGRNTPPLSEPIPPPAQPVKSGGGGMMVVMVIFGLIIIGGMGFFGWQLTNQLADLNTQLGEVKNDLSDAKDELKEANAKLTKAEEEAKLAKEAAELAKQKSEEEAAARKAAEEAAKELEAKLKAAEEAAAAKEKEGTGSTPAPDGAAPPTTPNVVEPPAVPETTPSP